MKKIWETAAILFAMMGFWGMIYPDLCFTGDVCVVIKAGPEDAYESVALAGDEEEGQALMGGSLWEDPQAEAVVGIFQADREQIRIKSRLFGIFRNEDRGQRGNEERDDVVSRR